MHAKAFAGEPVSARNTRTLRIGLRGNSMRRKSDRKIDCRNWLRRIGLLLGVAAFHVAAQGVLAPVAPDKEFLASVKILAVLEIEDPAYFTIPKATYVDLQSS